MRLKITAKVVNEEVLDFNHQQYLLGLVYEKLKYVDPDFATALHNKKGYKFFTFSWIFFKRENYKVTSEGFRIPRHHRIWFYVSSPDKKLLDIIAKGFLGNPLIQIGKLTCLTESVKVFDRKINSEKVVFETLSPVISTTLIEKNGSLKIYDLPPTEKKFHENIKNNLIKKYTTFYSRSIDNPSFEIKKIFWVKPKKIKIKNLFFTSYLMKFTAVGTPELLQMAYDSGLGEKNSSGFGMLKVIRTLK